MTSTKDAGTGPRFRWASSWQPAGGHGAGASDWAHHGIAVTAGGDVVTMAADTADVVILAPDGSMSQRWSAPVVAGHGLSITREGEDERLWIADNGVSAPAGPDAKYVSQRRAEGQHGAAVKLTLAGEEQLRLTAPPLEVYDRGNFAPTDVAVDERSRGGTGDVWVADGYGRHLVHRYDESGRYTLTLTGEDGAGHFDQPHAVFIDRRRAEPELYVADRGNARVQVFGLDGTFRRAFGVGQLVSPGGFAVSGRLLLVSELDARISVLDADDQLIGTVGQSGPARRDRAGWPNRLDGSGRPIRPKLSEDELNSPHGIATDAAGNLYVTEWLIGGRVMKFLRQQ